MEIKRNILKVYLTPILLIIFTFSFTPIIIPILLEEFERGKLDYTFYISFLAVLTFPAIGIYELYKRLKKAPKVSISTDEIKISKNYFLLKNIKGVTLTGKFHFQNSDRYNIKELMFREGMEIKFQNGETVHLFNEFYENLDELKLKLEKTLKIKDEVAFTNINFKQTTFRNNQFFRLRGIITWGIIGWLLFKNIFLNEINTNGIIFLFTICLMLWYWQSKFMYYFIFDKGKLTVKNENFFWVDTSFNLKDIKEVVFEKDAKLYDILKRKHLRIILKNHKQYLFSADLLKTSMWKNLNKTFKSLGIKVRDDF